MKPFILTKIKYLSEGSSKSDNTGHSPIQALYMKSIVNINTGEVIEVTDLQCKLRKRDSALRDFFGKYGNLWKNGEISILSNYVDAVKYDTIATFNSSFNKKLKRKGIKRLGYVWVRDIGDIKFEKHFHVLIATSRITAEVFRSLFKAKKDNRYKVQFLKTKNGMRDYIMKKELYAASKQRSYGRSRKFYSHK